MDEADPEPSIVSALPGTVKFVSRGRSPRPSNGAKRRGFMSVFVFLGAAVGPPARIKKVAIFALKVAILLGLLEYARRQSQIADEIAVLAPGAEIAGEIVGAGVRLEVVGVNESSGTPIEYRVATPRGAYVVISASEVEGSLGHVAGGAMPDRFSLLPGLATLFRTLDWRLLALAFASFGPPLFLMAVRWRLLLRASGVDVPFWTLVRLHYMAFFFNTFM